MKKITRNLNYLLFLLLISLLSLTSCSRMRSIDFQQLYVGFNGPKVPNTYYYQDQASLDKSWVRLALNDIEYNQLFSKIDFKRHVVLAFALGETKPPIGEVKITRLRQYVGKPSSQYMSASVDLGIVDARCSKTDTVAYPFVLAVFDIPENFNPFPGDLEIDTFFDKCTNKEE